jgi:hypothetical protein
MHSLTVIANTRLAKKFPRPNALAYFVKGSVIKKKSFIVLTLERFSAELMQGNITEGESYVQLTSLR